MLCWGYWSLGQPGMSPNLQGIVAEPQVCGFTSDRRVKEVACGGNHSVFLLEDGEVYTCGLNTKGQLGHEREGNKPEQIGALADQHIVHVACGESHSLALSDRGQLFSWGAGSDGQLGLVTTEDSVAVPRLIQKLNQQTILQVSCGNWHCLALAAAAVLRQPLCSSCFSQGLDDEGAGHHCCSQSLSGGDGQFFTWGKNSHGQLGLGKEFPSQASPQRVRSLEGIPLAQVTAGGAHSFALSLSGAVFGWGMNNAGQLGLSDEKDRESPCHVKLLRTQKVVYISCGEEHTAVLTKSGGVFTFGAGSCGQLGHDSMNDEVNPRRVLELMGSEVTQIACGRQHTLAFVPSSGLIYAFGCGARGQLGTGHTCNVKCPSPVKGYWAAHSGQLSARADRFKYHIVKQIFSGGDQTFVLCSKYEKARPSIMQDAVTLCSYPFIFDAQAKTKMLQTDAELQMQVAVNGANLQNVFMLLTLEPLLARSPFLVLHVRRSNLVGDALRELSIHSDIDLKKPLKVIFDGEEAVDAGGVTKEFFLLLLKELLNPIYGMFTYYQDSNLLWFSDKCFVEHNWFHLIGITCGLAIYNSTVVDLHFPLALYKKLLNVKPGLEDLKELSPTEGRSLQELLDYPGEDIEETFCLNFTICRESYGVIEQKKLIPGGDKVAVCKENRQEFVDAYVNYVFQISVHEWYTAFSSGFRKVCGGKVLELFQPPELRAMMVGSSSYSWEELEETAIYKGDYSATHPTVKLFWETFHEFPLEKKKKFLLFLTGSDRIPIYGMASLQIVIQPTASGEEYLPVAHTCYNLLDLPKYSSKEVLCARLTQALDNYEGFSLA
ncbi:probable E3 ubiquitin-protein ligase HERC3 isoform X7 [Balaenoptera acutorostrata]|uniref:Probable E3 ubiquitin-protein ligase HERC3 isoform X7 n=1 Tax=Balaenoptera acutorostrata TaxID=9767 RepID=A0ABM3TJV0_BALAC|nr:probable E3 ubiquitin-protein ligase HERC3 isoform X7 [Balaenoptera acutorostrata]